MVVLAAVGGVRLAARFGLPGLLFYLGLGLLLGEDGPGGIPFDDAQLATALGYAGLVIILAEGGLTTRTSTVRPVVVPAIAAGHPRRGAQHRARGAGRCTGSPGWTCARPC